MHQEQRRPGAAVAQADHGAARAHVHVLEPGEMRCDFCAAPARRIALVILRARFRHGHQRARWCFLAHHAPIDGETARLFLRAAGLIQVVIGFTIPTPAFPRRPETVLGTNSVPENPHGATHLILYSLLPTTAFSFLAVIHSCMAVITARSRPTNPCAVNARQASPRGS